MSEPKELKGIELLEHATKLYQAVKEGKEIEIWSPNSECWGKDICNYYDFILPLWRYRVAPEKQVRYLNVYKDECGGFYKMRETADKCCSNTRTACIRVEFVEGQYDV